MGVASTVTKSHGKSLKAPHLLSPRERQGKKCLQRKLARHVKGSRRCQGTKTAIAKLSPKKLTGARIGLRRRQPLWFVATI